MSISKPFQGVRLYDAVGNVIKSVQDGADYLLGVAAKIRNSAGTIINPATDERLTDSVDANNSTTSQLAADAVFTGTSSECLGYRSVAVSIESDQDSAEDGIALQLSQNGTDWVTVYTSTLLTDQSNSKAIRVPVRRRYFRLIYTNGDTTTTTLKIQTIFYRTPPPEDLIADGDAMPEWVQSTIIGGVDQDRRVRWARINENNDLRVVVADDPGEPIFVTLSAGQRSYYHNNLVNVDEPARIDAGADGPYEVGGDTFTISVDGGANQTPTFATRAAQPGIHYSASHPRTANPDTHKLKVSVDGGALEEVEIGKGWTTGAAIAAALQAEIRANIENGTSVTVEYNTADYPFRYVFKSGTTGASSSIHVEKGGDDLAKKVLFVGLPFGGTELPGLAANYYFTAEVVSYLFGELSDVQIFQEEDGFFIQTVAAGGSASLQVTAGGANTDFQFTTSLTSGTAGSGDDDLGVDGSSSAVRYAVVPPSGRTFVVDKLRFWIRDDGIALNKFAGQDALTNGVKLEIRNEGLGLIPVTIATTSAALMSEATEGEIVDNGWATGGQDLLKAIFDFSPGLSISEGSITNFVVTIQDDLSALDGVFYVRASGWIEKEAD